MAYSEPSGEFYPKNHMVATLVSAEPQIIDNKYVSARLSMELGAIKGVVAIVGQTVCSTCGPRRRLGLSDDPIDSACE